MENWPAEPSPDCRLCERLVEFRTANVRDHPGWFNAPVPSFGDPGARLLVVGLAPGLQGANKTGRPFTGDYAGDLLYATLAKFGLSKGVYAANANDGLSLHDCMITNAVRCVPPQNKPVGAEMGNCRPFLTERIRQLPNLVSILALGRIAHDNTLASFGYKKSAYAFAHGAEHELENGLTLHDSYHCSRYNTNTGRLTTEMFESVFEQITDRLRKSRSSRV